MGELTFKEQLIDTLCRIKFSFDGWLSPAPTCQFQTTVFRAQIPRLEPESVPRILQKKGSNIRLSGNEIFCTNASILLGKHILCSNIHLQKGCKLRSFPYEIRFGAGSGRGGAHRADSRSHTQGCRLSPPPSKTLTPLGLT